MKGAGWGGMCSGSLRVPRQHGAAPPEATPKQEEEVVQANRGNDWWDQFHTGEQMGGAYRVLPSHTSATMQTVYGAQCTFLLSEHQTRLENHPLRA